MRAYRIDIKQFARHLPRSCGPGRVRRATIEGWVATLQKHPYARNSIHRKLASLRSFYAYLVESGKVSVSPLADVRVRLGAVKRLTRIVLRRDVRALVKSADRQARRNATGKLPERRQFIRLRNALIVRILCVTGMRVGELVSLQLADVHQREKTLNVHGKGSRERLAFVAADPATARMLDRYLRKRKDLFRNQDSLFVGFAGQALTTDSVRQLLRMLGTDAGATGRITPHMLRHTAATTLLENGADIRIVQEFLGHGSIRSTERYTHVSRAHLQRVLRRTNPLKRVA